MELVLFSPCFVVLLPRCFGAVSFLRRDWCSCFDNSMLVYTRKYQPGTGI